MHAAHRDVPAGRAMTREATLANLKRRLTAGELVLGIQHNSASEAVVEVIAYAGFDWILLDMEHSAYTPEAVERLVQAAEAVGLAALVRVPENAPTPHSSSARGRSSGRTGTAHPVGRRRQAGARGDAIHAQRHAWQERRLARIGGGAFETGRRMRRGRTANLSASR